MELITINVQSFTDIITNSSSELFVLNDSKISIHVTQLLDSLGDDWQKYYHQPKTLDSVTESELTTYIQMSMYWDFSKISKELGYEMDDVFYQPMTIWMKWKGIYEEGDVRYDPPYEGDREWLQNRIPYEIKLRKRGLRKVLKYLKDTEPRLIFLFSRHDNPRWSGREQLLKIADRIHLG